MEGFTAGATAIFSCCVCGSRDAALVRHCSGCQVACYCGSACQRADWPDHKHECRHPLDYNESVLCSTIMARLMSNQEARNRMAAIVRASGPTTHGLSIRIANAHQARLVLTRSNAVLAVSLLTELEQYSDCVPYSATSKR